MRRLQSLSASLQNLLAYFPSSVSASMHKQTLALPVEPGWRALSEMNHQKRINTCFCCFGTWTPL
jgi:hypothetical protein